LKASLVLAVAGTVLSGCHYFDNRASQPATAVHYVVGQPYQAGGVWRYPRAQFEYDETGIATVIGAHPRLTTDGELYDAGLLVAAHRTLQVPAIARVTNLQTGRQVLVRLNDRGPASPGRLIALTPRAADLLGAGGQAAFPVRVQVEEAESRQLAAELNGGDAPHLQIATAPQAAVKTEMLAAPAGAQQAAQARSAAAQPAPPTPTSSPVPSVPLRLPETVTQVVPRSPMLYVEAGSFGRLEYAEILRARLAALGAQTSTSYDAPRERAYRVRIGPLPNLARADAMLDRTLRAGVTDARIIAE
jgi:rare lipoprotein A